MAMLPENGVQGLMTGILGSAAALAIAFPLALGGSVYDPAAATGAARTGFYATNGAGSESVHHVVGGVDAFSVANSTSGAVVTVVGTQAINATLTGSVSTQALLVTATHDITALVSGDAIQGRCVYNPGAASSANYRGVVGVVNSSIAANGGSFFGLWGAVGLQAGATGAYNGGLYGGYSIITNVSTATISIGYGFYADNPVNSGGGTFTTYHAFHVPTLTTAGTNYAFFSAGAGLVKISDTTASTTTTTGAMVIGGGLGVGGAGNFGGNVAITSGSGNQLSVTSSAGAATAIITGATNAQLSLNAATGSTAIINFFVNSTRTNQISNNSSGNLLFSDSVNSTTFAQYTAGALSAGFVTFANTTVSTSSATGAVVISGGLGVASAVNAGGVVITGTALQCSSARTSYTGSNHVDIYRSGGTITPNAGDMVFQSDIAGTNGFYWAAKASTANVMSLTGAGNLTVTGSITVGSTTLLTSSVALTNNAGSSAGTLTNAPSVGNPTKWIPINDNGTTRNIPAW